MLKRKKLDEMELDIRNKSVIASQRFTEMILAIWIVVCLVTKQSCMLPAYVLISQWIVRIISSLIYKRQVGDERWKRGLIILVSVIGGILFLLMVTPFFLIGVGEAS